MNMEENYEEIETDLEIIERLLDPFYEKLIRMGIANERLPTVVQLVSHLVDFVDQSRLEAWLNAYAAAEGDILLKEDS